MAKFNTLTVKEVKRETAEAVSVLFEIPENLKNDYTFKQGQYLTLKTLVNGQELRRSYSICSSPFNSEGLRIAVKQVRDGRVSTFLNQNLKTGDKLEVMTPMGNFHSELHPENYKNYILFAGGSGVTPMMSILKAVFEKEPNSKVILFYGNLNETATIFKNELDNLAEKHNHKLQLKYIFDKPENTHFPALQTGIMDKNKVSELIKNYVDIKTSNEYFVCGPTPMMDNVKSALESLSVPKEKLHIEYFTASLETAKTTPEQQLPNVTAQVTVIMYGIETDIELASNSKSILDAALDAGVDVPFACKGAVCCTCRAKVVEGKVKMDANFALSEEEVAQGYVLTCQSHPLTPVVKVDYDAV